MSVDTKRYRKRAVMFADGRNGMHMQVYGVYAGEVDTGIRETSNKANHKSPWEVVVTLGDDKYPTIRAALEAYESPTSPEAKP